MKNRSSFEWFFRFAVALSFLMAGCGGLWVRIAVRDFSRSAGRGNKKGVMNHSTSELNEAVWENISAKEFSSLMKKLRELISKKDGEDVFVSEEEEKKTGKKARRRKISVDVKRNRARLNYRKGSVKAKFELKRRDRKWKVDDVWVDLDEGKLSLKRDFSIYESGYGFFRAASKGSREDLMLYSSRSLASAIGKLSESMIRQGSRRLVPFDSGDSGDERGEDGDYAEDEHDKLDQDDEEQERVVRYTFEFSENRAQLKRIDGDKVHGIIMVREDSLWKVDDLLVSYKSLSGEKKIASVKNLTRATAAVYDYLTELAAGKLWSVRRKPREIAKREKSSLSGFRKVRVMGLSLSEQPRLAGYDFTESRASVALESGDLRLTAYMETEDDRWKVKDLKLEKRDLSITLGEALAFRKILFSVLDAGFRGDFRYLMLTSTESLNRKAWTRLKSARNLKERLIAGGLDEFLGIKVLPPNAFARVAWAADMGSRLQELRKKKVDIRGAWTLGDKGKVHLMVFGRRVDVIMKKTGSEWKLDDVRWKTSSGMRSLKTGVETLLPEID